MVTVSHGTTQLIKWNSISALIPDLGTIITHVKLLENITFHINYLMFNSMSLSVVVSIDMVQDVNNGFMDLGLQFSQTLIPALTAQSTDISGS